MTAASPTPPSPKTATDSPGRADTVCCTAPTPVSSAHPNSAATGKGTSSGMTTADARSTTAYSLKAETPRWWCTAVPLRRSRWAPRSSVPAPLAVAAGAHSAGVPALQCGHEPQAGTNTSTTWSPGRTSRTAGPTSTTTPAASCPSAIGTGRTRLPSTTDRSEWHTPAASTRTSSSPSPGGSSSSSATVSGRDRAYGRGAPISVSTAARVVIGRRSFMGSIVCTVMEQVNPRRADFPVLRPITTRWADNDVYGHVNNVVYYSYFDTAVNGWLMDATGTDIRLLPAIGLVAETSCRFL